MNKLIEYRYNGTIYSNESAAQDAATQRLSGFAEEIKSAYSITTITQEIHDKFVSEHEPNIIVKITTHIPEAGGTSNGTAFVHIDTAANFGTWPVAPS